MTLTDYKNILTEFGAQDEVLAHTEENPSVFYRVPEKASALLADQQADKIVMLIAPYVKDNRSSNAHNAVWNKQGLVLILGKVEQDNPESELQVMDTCEQVADRLYQYLYHRRGADARLFGIDLNNWNCEDIGPVGQNHYGYCALFFLKDPVKL